jgi:hypothetical protein
MTRSKKIFLGFVLVFLVSISCLVYDISRKTSFPGSGKQSKPALKQDSLTRKDTLKSILPPK